MKNLNPRNKRYFKTLRNSYWWRFVTTGVTNYFSSAGKYFNYRRFESNLRLHALHNRYAGQRCFIIGNGPSLKSTDLSLLRNEITFGSNRLYILFDELGFSTTFFLTISPLVVEQYHRDIDRINSIKFMRAGVRHYFTLSKRVILLENGKSLTFALNPAQGVWGGGSVTYTAMQLAYQMGFEKVILIGVDHAYDSTRSNIQKNVVKVSEGADPNHFSSEYFGKGASWFVPNLELQALGYRMAKYAFESDGREILDATIGGKLNLFPKVDYYSLFH